MKNTIIKNRLFIAGALSCLSFLVSAAPPPGAQEIKLQTSCDSGDNLCFTRMKDMLNWIWDTRQPSKAAPLLVNIGAGTFNIGHTFLGGQELNLQNVRLCEGGGHVTFRGAGRDNTVIVGAGPDAAPGVRVPAMSIRNCENLSFESMTIRADKHANRSLPNPNKSITGIVWQGGGSSNWSDIAIEATAYGWYDFCSAGDAPGKHRWFGSSIDTGRDEWAAGYRTECGASEYYGGYIKTIKGASLTVGQAIGVAAIGQDASLAIYGSLVRVFLPVDSYDSDIYNVAGFSNYSLGNGGIAAANGGTVHMHGGIISAKSARLGGKIFGIKSVNNGTVHTLDTAFGMSVGVGGEVQRILKSNDATVDSPFQWSADVAPPVITSTIGADMFIETDCDSSGDCSGNGTGLHPNLMLYDPSCNGGSDPWFNSTTGKCRGL